MRVFCCFEAQDIDTGVSFALWNNPSIIAQKFTDECGAQNGTFGAAAEHAQGHRGIPGMF